MRGPIVFQLMMSRCSGNERARFGRSEEHTSELQSLRHLVCRLLLEKKKLAYKACEGCLNLRAGAGVLEIYSQPGGTSSLCHVSQVVLGTDSIVWVAYHVITGHSRQ